MDSLFHEIKLVLSTHWAFYRRHPWLVALFVLGFSLGSALLTAITGLNQEAKGRYKESSALIEQPVSHIVKPLIGQTYLPGKIWLELRKQGFTNAQPVLRGQITTTEGRRLSVQGVDTLMWINQQQYQQSDSSQTQTSQQISMNTVLVDEQFRSRFVDKTGNPSRFDLTNNQRQPSLVFVEGIGLWSITDLAHADYLLSADGGLSFIELINLEPSAVETVEAIISGRAVLVHAHQQNFDVLSDAFFFNLTALALLGYIVAAFLSVNAIKLTLSARKKLMHQMSILGCTSKAIQLSLIIELLVVSAITALLGATGGYFISNLLVLDVNRTLMGLYQLDKALVIHWQWSNVLLGLALNIVSMLFIGLASSRYWQNQGSKLFIAAFIVTVIGTSLLYFFAQTKLQSLMLCFGLIVLFILVVPKALNFIAKLPLSFQAPLIQWLYRDIRFHLQDLHIAIIAILVALGSAIGMQIMVKSFGNTLDEHLAKQLSADIYLRTGSLDEDLRNRLNNSKGVERVSVYLQSEGAVDQVPTKLASFGDSSEYYQHISLVSGAPVTEKHWQNQGCLANEQSRIKFDLRRNQVYQFVQNNKVFNCRITGYFYDYGNPSIQLFTLENRQKASGLHWQSYGYSIYLNPAISEAKFTEMLIENLGQDSTKIIPNRRFKQYASTLFNDTFMVTKALNGFILSIALLSLATSLLSIGASQVKQLLILRNLGVSYHQLLAIKLTQTALIVGFTALFAIPLGFVLGIALLKYVMPIAFGWTIHFSLDVNALVLTTSSLVVVAVVCAYLPIKKLLRSQVVM